MANRFSIFLTMGAFVISVMLFHPSNTLGLMNKETLLSFNKGGMDLIPDVRVINTQGSVTYTITVKGQKKDGENVDTADKKPESSSATKILIFLSKPHSPLKFLTPILKPYRTQSFTLYPIWCRALF